MKGLRAEEVTESGWYENDGRFVEIEAYKYPVYVRGILKSSRPQDIERYEDGLLLEGQAYRPDWGDELFYGPIDPAIIRTALPLKGQVVPVEPTKQWLQEVAVMADVWPASDKDNVPPAILDAIKCYHRAMLAAHSLSTANDGQKS